ncbi:MAG: hypothetical protein H0X66_06375 [Verrucomicrobia bacterium]|nr:hypothetical protein [Verrucomicrobiota bacterium]
MKHATKRPGDELREKSRTVGRPPKRVPQKPRQVGEQTDELGVTRGQNAEKGNTTKPETIRTGDEAAAH